MASKLTKSEINKRLQRAIAQREQLEQQDMIKALHAWEEAPQNVKARIINEWDQYYKNVDQTPIYALFQEQREAMSRRDYGRVKELADEARRMREDGNHITLEKPRSIDPFDYQHHPLIKAYRRVNKQIKELLYA